MTRDPPFSRLDLILCRNVLIYLGPDLQRKVMSVFHYALKVTGFLVLGAAESIGVRSDLFAVADKKHRIYDKKILGAPEAHFAFQHMPVAYATVAPAMNRRDPAEAPENVRSVAGEANRVIQERYAPPGVIVDANLQIVQFRGQTGAFLEPAPGDPSMSVLKMARDGLLQGLRAAIQEARRTRIAVRKGGLRVRANGGWRNVEVEVIPLSLNERPHFLVLFDAPGHRLRAGKKPRRARRRDDEAPMRGALGAQLARLREELASSREYLQSIIQDLEAANEELQSANEEVLSANEELQSTNEELDTAKEELQSTNEELNTVNEELQGRNEELARVNSDLVNLLGSVQIAIVIVAADLRIRRFTPMAERVLNLLPGDVGRPIGHIKPNIDCADLEEQIAHVIDTVTPVEREVRDRQGRWLSMRIRPYKSVDSRIDGAVIALFDVEEARQHEEAVRRARDFAEAIVQTVRHPLVVLNKDLRVQTVNAAFSESFGLSAAQTEGRLIDELGSGQWNIPDLRKQLEDVLHNHPRLDNFEIRHPLSADGGKTLRLHARRIAPGGDREALILLALEERQNHGERKATSSG